MAQKDRWATWIASFRSVGDAELQRRGLERLGLVRDRVLEDAALAEGETLLDVGCGEGLVGFGALERGAGTVVFSDISTDLLEFCRAAAADLGVLDRCRFVQASADDLGELADQSVDVVATRSVLIYVEDKGSAFREFFRLLRPGGRITLFEPINRFARTDAETWFGYDLGAVADVSQKIRAVYDAIQPPDTDPMLNFDERDLFRLAEEAGFFPVHLRLEAESKPPDLTDWEAFSKLAGNPRIPSLARAMEHALTPEERERLTSHLRPLVEGGQGAWRLAVAYLWATKPRPES